MTRASLVLVLLLTGTAAFALESRPVDSGGNAVAGAQISVVDQSGNARTDSEGLTQH